MGGSISGAQDAVSFSEQNALPQKARRGTRIAKVRKTVGGNPLQANGQRKSFSLKIECCGNVRTKAKKKQARMRAAISVHFTARKVVKMAR